LQKRQLKEELSPQDEGDLRRGRGRRG
jgi:hypothetical protein